jgi:hypothetical protein
VAFAKIFSAFVEFSVRNADAVKNALQGIHQGAQAFANAAGQAGLAAAAWRTSCPT